MTSGRHLFHLHSIQRSQCCNKQRISILSAKYHRNGSFGKINPVAATSISSLITAYFRNYIHLAIVLSAVRDS